MTIKTNIYFWGEVVLSLLLLLLLYSVINNLSLISLFIVFGIWVTGVFAGIILGASNK